MPAAFFEILIAMNTAESRIVNEVEPWIRCAQMISNHRMLFVITATAPPPRVLGESDPVRAHRSNGVFHLTAMATYSAMGIEAIIGESATSGNIV
jgi:hypothetical protein